MKKLLYVVVFGLGFSACETVLDVPVPEIPKKAVVFANITSTSSLQTIQLTESKPIINESTSIEFDEIEDASVSVTVNSDVYSFEYVPQNHYINLEGITFNPGDSVKLNINSRFGTTTGVVKVPNELPGLVLQVDKAKREWDTELFVNLDLKDDNGVSDYYRIEAFADYGDDTVEVWTTRQYYTDENIVDGNVRLSTSAFVWEGEDGNNPNIFLIISSITQDHYEYGKALEVYEPDNPFAEPSPLPNNVEGGLGIFTVSMSKVVELK